MGVRVLVVDDDEVSREVLAALLDDAGYRVEAVESGDAAEMYVRAVRPLPEVVLADMQMPGLSGDALARQLREACGAGTVLLAMSGSAPADEVGGEFDGFLLKPFSMEALAAAIAGGVAGAERRPDGVRVLDETVYAKLAARMPAAKLDELYALCLADTERRVSTMRVAGEAGADEDYRRSAHAIRGSAGMVGATELQKLATCAEQRGLRDDHVASHQEFMLSCERLRRMLVAHQNGVERAMKVPGDDAQ
ncbi:MAG: response regulator [Acidobacteriota bacterium]|nr:response regulator [Acidobacteriota bacterium]